MMRTSRDLEYTEILLCQYVIGIVAKCDMSVSAWRLFQKLGFSQCCSGLCWLHLAPSLSRFESAHSIDASLTSLIEGFIPNQNEVEERLQLSQVELEPWAKT
jgi:hypothetical protein